MPKRTAKQLTEPGIEKMAKAKPGQRREVYDKLAPGLALRVTDRGTKTWAVHYRYGGKHQRITLGEWPSLRLEDARDEVRNVRGWVKAGVDPKTVRRERAPDHGAIREAMREIAGQRRRFAYRRIGVMLDGKGMSMNHKKLYRLYRDEGLSVRRRRGRKRARGTRTPVPGALRPGDRWTMDWDCQDFRVWAGG